MITRIEHNELLEILRRPHNRDLLPSFPLFTSQIESAALLYVLRTWSKEYFPVIEEELKFKFSLITFGSLGRLEFVRGQSDIDPIIIIDSDEKIDRNIIRSKVISPIAKSHPWLAMDEKQDVVDCNWVGIKNVDLKYPVFSIKELFTFTKPPESHRKLQFLLEARPIWNNELFETIYDNLLPQIRHTVSDWDGEVLQNEIHFEKLSEDIISIYQSFDDPHFLYKDPYKYWKTRFLREFYMFATSLQLVLGYYLQAQPSEGMLPENAYIRASTTIKLVRSITFAKWLDIDAYDDQDLDTDCQKTLKDILIRYKIDERALDKFPGDYKTESARMLHGLIVNVISRFSTSWGKIYDPEVKRILMGMEKEHIDFDARFRRPQTDPQAQNLCDDLLRLRKDYLKYIGATSEAVLALFPRGNIKTKEYDPQWLQNALTNYIL